MKRLSGLFAATLFLFAVSAQAQQDPFVGTWKLNLSKSKYDPGPAPKEPTILKREALPGGQTKSTTDGVNAQGNKTHTEITYKLDGKDYPVTGSQNEDTDSVRQVGSDTQVTVAKKNGNVVRMIRRVVSKDGRSYTAEQIGVNAQGQAYHNIVVYDKQ